MRTKGEVERDIAKLGYPHLAIHRPGLLANRDNDERIGEKILNFIPFITKIESSDMGLAMLEHSIRSCQNKKTGASDLLSNSDLVSYARDVKNSRL
jgi:hypothetical protein